MTQEQPKLRIERSLEETFVTINESKLLDDESLKEMQTVLMELIDSGEHNKLLLNFSEVLKFLQSSFLEHHKPGIFQVLRQLQYCRKLSRRKWVLAQDLCHF